MITNAAEARAGEGFIADAGMRVCGEDDIGTFGNGLTRHEARIFQYVQRYAGGACGLCQAVIFRWRNDAGELDAFFFA